ncbi:hypothetical protein [Paenibacillus sp. FSL R7-0128]|uniref:hypothetical protein n=1 Tax=Paenibacillus sp. FSL R7-0128 TaxID=2954529 RepID=UPI0030F7A926
MEFYPVVYQHASWLSVNPIQGCPKQCQYCFLQSINKIGVKPEVLASIDETIELILTSPFYSETVPLCFLSETDAFSTIDNIKYVRNLLLECNNNQIDNPKIFITKCHIPDEIIDLFCELIKKGKKIVVYLSYSGLDNTIERGVIHKHIRENFKRLHTKGVPIVHYWRPFVPQNSSYEKLNEVIDFVKNYAKVSVVAGLKVEENYVGKLTFWPELIELKRSITDSEGVWPEHVIPFFNDTAQVNQNYPIFQSNSCALSYVLSQPDYNAFFESEICKNFNKCPIYQRNRCEQFYLNKEVTEEEIVSAFEKINLEYDAKNVRLLDSRTLQIDNTELTVAKQSFLTQYLKIRVNAKKDPKDIYWNTSVSGARPLLVSSDKEKHIK